MQQKPIPGQDALDPPDADVALDLLPARARGLAVASRDLFTRAHAADTALAA